MKRNGILKCLLLSAVLACAGLLGACGGTTPAKPPVKPNGAPTVTAPTRTVTESKLTVYDGPALLDSSSKVKAYVEGTELFVYDTRVNHLRMFTWGAQSTTNQVVNFDFEGRVHMRVEVTGATTLTDVVVRPLSYGVQPTVSGNTIEFDLSYSANYTLEYNDGKVTDAADNALHIFANPIEQNPITADNVPDNTVYIGPGVYSAGAIPLKSGQTLYLAGDAYVYGQIRIEELNNVTIRGRGIIDGEKLVINPTLPSIWQGYSFKLNYKGCNLDIKVTRGKATVTVSGGSVNAVVCGKDCVLSGAVDFEI